MVCVYKLLTTGVPCFTMDRGGSSVLVYGLYAFLAKLAFLPFLFLMHLNSGARSQVALPRKKETLWLFLTSQDRTYHENGGGKEDSRWESRGARDFFRIQSLARWPHGGASKEGEEDRRRQASTQGQSYIGRAGKPPPPPYPLFCGGEQMKRPAITISGIAPE